MGVPIDGTIITEGPRCAHCEFLGYLRSSLRAAFGWIMDF